MFKRGRIGEALFVRRSSQSYFFECTGMSPHCRTQREVFRPDRPSATGVSPSHKKLSISCRPKAVKDNHQRIAIDTPDHFALGFELAGIGTRFLAYLLDKTIQASAVFGLFFALWLLFFLAGQLGSLGDWLLEWTKMFSRWLSSFGTFALVIIAAGYFLIFEMAYFAVFEYLWSGMTPGKRCLGIRVIRQDARPMTFIDAAVRNMLRFVDLLGQFYSICLVVMFLDAHNRRLGDLAAGTYVIIETTSKAPSLVGADGKLPWLDADMRNAVLEMTPEDYQLVAKFLARREGLDPTHRAQLVENIYRRVFKRSADLRAGGRQAEQALEALAAQYLDKARIL